MIKNLTTHLLIGGTSTDTDIHILSSNKPQIIIGCPGRIHDMIRRGKINLKSNDRVLVISGESLLWALHPLNLVSEGGVTILVDTLAKFSRLSAQLEALDPIQRPVIQHHDWKLSHKLSTSHEFEMISGRLYENDFINIDIYKMFQELTDQCAPNASINILFSRPIIGPAKALSDLLLLDKSQEEKDS